MVKKLTALLLSVVMVSLCGCSIKKSDSPKAGTSDASNNTSKEVVTTETNTTQENVPRTMVDIPDAVAGQFDNVSEKYGCTGVQVAVIKDGAVAYHYEYGYANKQNNVRLSFDSKLRCASLSKLIVALTTMAVSESSDYDIDGDIGNYLGYSVRNSSFKNDVITPRMLMTHTSSIVDGSAFLDSRNAHSSVQLKTLLSKGSSYANTRPGTYYSYSNFGVAVLAASVESYMGRYFDELAKEKLFNKLDLDCGFLAKDISDPSLVANLYLPGGSVGDSAESLLAEYYCDQIGQTHHIYQGNLTISAVDYAKLLCVLINDGKSGSETIVSKSSVNEILRLQASTGENDCGLCVEMLTGVVPGRNLYAHDGRNFGMFSSFVFDKEAKDGVVVFTSGANAELVSSGVYNICEEIIRICYSNVLNTGN